VNRPAAGFGLALAALAFVLAATANSGGYRYGVSDQAFYATAIVKDLHPDFFPRDTRLLEVESHLMWSDEIVAALTRGLGLDLPTLALALYLATLVLLFAAAVRFGRAAGLSWWAIAALLVLLTFRHRIAKTGANSLEGYMHPRMLAFALGIFALSALLARRYITAGLWIAVAGCWHPTTALWFGLVLGFALMATSSGERRRVILVAALAAGAAALAGPLAGRLAIMDPAWLQVLADKDYLFPHEWPAYAWAANLGYPIVLYLIYRRRLHCGRVATGEREVVVGLLGLVGVFLVSLPLTMLRVALAVQLQVTRVFWLLDFAVAAYLAWWIVDDRLAASRFARRLAVLVLAAASVTRGAYLLSQDRQLVSWRLPDTPWMEAMTWLRDRPASWYVLADPGHAWKYGVSVRLAAQKDTLIEAGKDTALAIYDRDVAMAVRDKLTAVASFDQLTSADLRRLASRYGLDVAVLEAGQEVDLPELHRNRQFVIYKLR
jgi:hypothetical protein